MSYRSEGEGLSGSHGGRKKMEMKLDYDFMNARQRGSLSCVIDQLVWGRYEIKMLEVQDCGNGTVYVFAKRGFENDEGTVAQYVCRDSYVFFIGSRGGVYQFVETREGRYRSVYRKDKVVKPMC